MYFVRGNLPTPNKYFAIQTTQPKKMLNTRRQIYELLWINFREYCLFKITCIKQLLNIFPLIISKWIVSFQFEVYESNNKLMFWKVFKCQKKTNVGRLNGKRLFWQFANWIGSVCCGSSTMLVHIRCVNLHFESKWKLIEFFLLFSPTVICFAIIFHSQSTPIMLGYIWLIEQPLWI